MKVIGDACNGSYKIFLLGFLFVLILNYAINLNNDKVGAATDTVTVSTDVQTFLTLSITSGDPMALGNLTPGSPVTGSAGSVASCTTDAANGYTLGLSDGSDTNSALVHTDTTTYIADYAGTITTPTTWSGIGLGISLYAADNNKEAKWGTGTTYNDANNKYAGIPSVATTAHTVTGFHVGTDTSSWGWKADVANGQKTGAYSGNVTFTATAVLI